MGGRKGEILAWGATGVFAAIAVVLLVLLYTGLLFPRPLAGAAEAQELVAGTKRWPGTFGQPSPPVQFAPEPLRPDVTFNVEVMAFAFNPKELRVKQGQVVKVVLQGRDDGQLPGITGVKEFSGHGFHITGPYGIWVTGIRKGAIREVVFEAKYPGEYLIECPVFCGVGHYVMHGKLVVEEAR